MVYNHSEFIERQENTSATGATYRREVQDLGNNLVLVARYIFDNDTEPDYLGEFTDRATEWTIDRKHGVLYGAYLEKQYTVTAPDSVSAETALLALAKADQLDPDLCHDWHIDDLEDNTYTLFIDGYQIARRDLSHTYTYHSYRYFSPSDSYTPPGSVDHWDLDAESRFADVVKEYGSLENADIAYMIQDWERVESLNNQGWCYLGIESTLYASGIALGSDSLWGIESDSDDKYFQEIITEQIDTIKAEFTSKQEKRIAELYAQIATLQAIKFA